MIPASFISKWSKSELKERSSCQEHFMDLCRTLARLLVKPRVAGHRSFIWPNGTVLPDCQLIAFPTHRVALFETFPEGLRRKKKEINRDEGDKRDEKQKQAALSLSPSSLLNYFSSVPQKRDEARERWLNPENASESELKKRTLTNLCNEREAGRRTWLSHPHREMDHAVLGRLLALNLDRARLQAGGQDAGTH